jgi:hypothetical protein
MEGMKGPRQRFDFGGYSVREPGYEQARFTGRLWGRVAPAEPKETAKRQSTIHWSDGTGAAP